MGIPAYKVNEYNAILAILGPAPDRVRDSVMDTNPVMDQVLVNDPLVRVPGPSPRVYNLFVQHVIEKLKQPDSKMKDLFRIAAAKWRSMNHKTKAALSRDPASIHQLVV
jgi:hypothetical protein